MTDLAEEVNSLSLATKSRYVTLTPEYVTRENWHEKLEEDVLKLVPTRHSPVTILVAPGEYGVALGGVGIRLPPFTRLTAMYSHTCTVHDVTCTLTNYNNNEEFYTFNEIRGVVVTTLRGEACPSNKGRILSLYDCDVATCQLDVNNSLYMQNCDTESLTCKGAGPFRILGTQLGGLHLPDARSKVNVERSVVDLLDSATRSLHVESCRITDLTIDGDARIIQSYLSKVVRIVDGSIDMNLCHLDCRYDQEYGNVTIAQSGVAGTWTVEDGDLLLTSCHPDLDWKLVNNGAFNTVALRGTELTSNVREEDGQRVVQNPQLQGRVDRDVVVTFEVTGSVGDVVTLDTRFEPAPCTRLGATMEDSNFDLAITQSAVARTSDHGELRYVEGYMAIASLRAPRG